MFSLRDASSASSSDEDSFGWWIGVDESRLPDSSSTKSDNAQPSSSTLSSSRSSTDDCHLRASELSRNNNVPVVKTTTPMSDEEQIELSSLDGAGEAGLDSGFGGSNSEGRSALSYTPERLVKSEDFRILPPSSRCYPTLADLMSSKTASSKGFRSLTMSDSWLSDRKIGFEHLAALLQSPYYESSSSSRSSCRRCCCIRYGGGEVLLHTERCPRYEEDKVDPRQKPGSELLFSTTPVTECGSFCDENSNKMRFYGGNKEQQLVEDMSGISSINCSATEEDEVQHRLQPRRLSTELAYLSFGTSDSQTDRTSNINDIVSILASLDSDPRRVEELLIDENRFRKSTQSGHDSLTRLALAIEPDDIPIVPAIKVSGCDDSDADDRYKLRYKSCHVETELEQLREKIERLQGSNKELYQEITSLRRDFTIDEWKVNHLSEDISKLRAEVYEVRYLDDLLKLLKGELERISNRNWPFTIGRTKHETEEINLIV